ncbi:CAP domain-containing protein [Clostridium sp. NSJ-49]|uniref:CAP domain-containing protein n=1 Tax=Clostridium TaxID=1485 RepID=UPI001FAE4990|nr:CAP domain-containing protein [Clostridium sp. NSJ-49]
MKSKIIALVIAGTTMLGTVSASAATRYYDSNNGGAYRHHCKHKYQRPCKPSQDEKPSTGDDNVVIPPTVGDDTTVTPPTSDDNTVVTLPAGEENTEVTPPTTGDDTTVTPPTNEGDAVTDDTNASDKFMAQVEQAIFNKVNEERVKAGVAPLSYNTTMEKYARIKSQDMGDNNYFSHTDLNGNYITAQMKADGVSYNSWGENIAYLGGYGTDPTVLANQFMTNWMNSSGHRKNILSTDFTSIGVGVYQIGNKVYATQEFYR